MVQYKAIDNCIGRRVTTREVDEKLLDGAMTLTGEKSRSRALNRVIADWVRDKRVEELRLMLGTVDLGDDWCEMWHAEPR